MEKDRYFMGIDDPEGVRRNLLESSRTMIFSLRRFSQIKRLRDQKKAKLEELRGHIKEITLLMWKLHQFMPKEPVEEKRTVLRTGAPIQQDFKRRIDPAKVDMLEKELDDIELKLSSMKKKKK